MKMTYIPYENNTFDDGEFCDTCIHEEECINIDGRQQGRGFGAMCRPPLDKPHYHRQNKKNSIDIEVLNND